LFFSHNRRMRAKRAAALTNFLLILVIAAGLMLASGPFEWPAEPGETGSHHGNSPAIRRAA
jgi:hypothetical protein